MKELNKTQLKEVAAGDSQSPCPSDSEALAILVNELPQCPYCGLCTDTAVIVNRYINRGEYNWMFRCSDSESCRHLLGMVIYKNGTWSFDPW